jgi:hypothetical protein
MMLGSPAVIPIIQAAGALKASDYATAAVPGRTGLLASALGVHDDIVAFNTAAHQADRADRRHLPGVPELPSDRHGLVADPGERGIQHGVRGLDHECLTAGSIR